MTDSLFPSLDPPASLLPTTDSDSTKNEFSSSCRGFQGVPSISLNQVTMDPDNNNDSLHFKPQELHHTRQKPSPSPSHTSVSLSSSLSQKSISCNNVIHPFFTEKVKRGTFSIIFN